MRFAPTLLFTCLLAAACSESTTTSNNDGGGGSGGQTSSGGSGAGTTATTAGSGGQTSSGGSGAGTTTAGSGGGTTSGGFTVVINEVNALDADYVELFNAGGSAVDLSSYGVTDSLDTGDPKLDEAARFPAGTSLGAGQYLLIVAQQKAAAGVGPHDTCLPDGGPSSCYYSTWGISASKGEKVFLVSPSDEVVSQVEYPADAVPAGRTWGRLPDGTGSLAENVPTPGEANKAP